MIEQRTNHPSEDPVCAMPVGLLEAREADLVFRHADVEYSFCSHACLTEFRDDPAWFLDPAYAPTAI